MTAVRHGDHAERVGGDAVVGWVAGEPLTIQLIDARLAELRGGPLSGRLPASDTAEGRNMRRWVVQLCAAELLVQRECRLRGIAVQAADDRAPARSRLDIRTALSVGGVAAAVLTRTPGAIELAAALAGDAAVSIQRLRSYYERNLDLYGNGARSFDDVSAEIERELWSAERDRIFAGWLDSTQRELLKLQPGFEHPAEPGHPDSTHRH